MGIEADAFDKFDRSHVCEEPMQLAAQGFEYEVSEDFSFVVHGLDPAKVKEGMDRETELLEYFKAVEE